MLRFGVGLMHNGMCTELPSSMHLSGK